MIEEALRVGRIDYLNVLPFFHHLEGKFPSGQRYVYVPGHPRELNEALEKGEIDVSPSSSFEYLEHFRKYRLLPDLSISSRGEVGSVFLILPFSFADLAAYCMGDSPEVGLTGASASSIALLKVLWRFAWNLPWPEWVAVNPGDAVSCGFPCLEIGDLALRAAVENKDNLYFVDLGRAWFEFTGLPFVFAVWIVRRNLSFARNTLLDAMAAELSNAGRNLPRVIESLLGHKGAPDWISRHGLREYWNKMSFDLDAEKRAGLILFGEYCVRLGLLPAVPALSFKIPL